MIRESLQRSSYVATVSIVIHQVFFRAGVLGRLEEMRDERLAKIMTMIQSACRWYLCKKHFEKLKEQR